MSECFHTKEAAARLMFRYIGHVRARLNIPPQHSVLVTSINSSELVGKRARSLVYWHFREELDNIQNLHIEQLRFRSPYFLLSYLPSKRRITSRTKIEIFSFAFSLRPLLNFPDARNDKCVSIFSESAEKYTHCRRICFL